MRCAVLVLLAALGLLCVQIQATPYSGTPTAIPGKIEAENFDLGGEGVGYHDTEAANLGGAYRTAEGVDIGDCFDAGQGYSIGWTRAGEWIQYTVSIATTGSYQIDVRYATPSCGGSIHFELDGTAITSSVALNATGGWQTWQTASFSADLTATSAAKLRIVMDSTGISGSVANLNYFNIYMPGSTPVLPTSPYALQKEYSGSTFFNDFNFFTAPDPTHGYVTYVDRTTATNAGLAKVTPSGQVYMAVDNTSVAWGAGRRSVRIESTGTYNGGLFVLDVEHMPTGCGTWPAFWLNGPNWPAGGEIDIFEGVHTSTATVTVLHTSAGCSQYGADSSKITGSWIVRNCYVNAPGQAANQGCGISGKVGTFGAPFNAGKGGVSATLWDSTGIRVWFFARGSIPDDLAGGQPQPSNWGLPYARFDFGAECPSWHFSNHRIIINTALCGDWAGGTFTSSCPNMGSCQSYVQNNPSAFSQAYWLINTLRVYQLRA